MHAKYMKSSTDTANGGEICIRRIQNTFKENDSFSTELFLQHFYAYFLRPLNQLISKLDDKTSTLICQCEQKARRPKDTFPEMNCARVMCISALKDF